MTKKIPILFILLIVLSVLIGPVFPEDLCADISCSVIALNYDLDGDVLYRRETNGKVKLYDKVAAISSDNDTLYYIRSVNEKWIAGFFRGDASENREFDLPGVYDKLYKFTGFNGVFYFLAVPVVENMDIQTERIPVYIRFNPDQMIHQSIGGVTDFILLNGKSVILKNGRLDYNGSEIPLVITGQLRIAEVIDSRIAAISGDDGSELVDLIAGKSIYQYTGDSVAEIPGEYNLIIEFEDSIIGTDNSVYPDNSIYYEMLIDGKEESRTETGHSKLKKSFYSKLNADSYHIVKPERWELDKTKGRYMRMNNINQPSEQKIYIPGNRIVKLRFAYDGTGYEVTQSVMFK